MPDIRKGNKDSKKTEAEFSKIMIKQYSICCIVWISASYVLAAFEKPANEAITTAVITSMAAVLVGYFVKSTKENINKNKKGGD